MNRMGDDWGKRPGKEIETHSLAMIETVTSCASTCASSVLDNAGFVSRSCFKSASRSSSADGIFVDTSPTKSVG